MKKMLSIFLVTIMLCGIFTGCSGNNAAPSGTPNQTSSSKPTDSQKPVSNEKKNLTVWLFKTYSEESNNVAIAHAEQFGKDSNLNMNIELVAQKDWFTKWAAAIEAKTTPDVSYFPYNAIAQYYSLGVLEPVDDLIAEVEKIQGNYIDRIKEAVKFDDVSYGVPINVQPQVLFYRKDKLKAAGYDEPPKTWDEYFEIAKAITNKSENFFGNGMGVGANNSDTEWMFHGMIAAEGASLTAEDGKTVTANDPKIVNMLAKFSNLLTGGYSPDSALNWDDSANNQAYLSGQVGMAFNVGTLLTAINKDAPDLVEVTGIAPVPAGSARSASMGAMGTYAIFKASTEKELAKDFICYMFNTDWYSNWIANTAPYFVPAFESAGDDPLWQDPINAVFYKSAQNFGSLGYPADLSSKLAEAFNTRYVNQALIKIVIENKTPEQGAEELAKMYKDLLK